MAGSPPSLPHTASRLQAALSRHHKRGSSHRCQGRRITQLAQVHLAAQKAGSELGCVLLTDDQKRAAGLQVDGTGQRPRTARQVGADSCWQLLELATQRQVTTVHNHCTDTKGEHGSC